MSLENFQLSPILLQELYSNSLVDLDLRQTNNQKSTEKNYLTLGGNKKNILILTEDSGALHLGDAEFNLLQGILSACKLHTDDIVLYNIHQNKSVEIDLLKKEFHPKFIIAFGIDANRFSLPGNYYEVKSSQKMDCLSAPSLTIILNNPEEKKKLWASLKILFSL